MSNKKLGAAALTALVLSSMLGAGVFSLPQNMAAVASSAALVMGWTITGVGILFLALALLYLTRLRPDLEGGIFIYAREGFGEVIGFISAWGYWLCAVIANASYLVVVFSALSFFTDSPDNLVFGNGNTWQAIIGASMLLWFIHYLMLKGVESAASINLLATIGKLVPLFLFILLAIIAFNYHIFIDDLFGVSLKEPLWEQVRQTMLITLWVFIGVEGAVVVSARARNKRDIGRATVLAVLIALLTYLLVTVLAMGIIPRPILAEMRNPSMAGILQALIGNLGAIIITAGMVLSVGGSYLSWTIMAAEIPHQIAESGTMPNWLAKLNKNAAPVHSLWLTNGCVQLCLLTIAVAHIDYNGLLTIASEMVLVPYLLVGLFLIKLTWDRSQNTALFIGIIASIYGAWLLYASGLHHLLMSVLLYAPGLMLFLYARANNPNSPSLQTWEKTLLAAIIFAAIAICGQGLLTL